MDKESIELSEWDDESEEEKDSEEDELLYSHHLLTMDNESTDDLSMSYTCGLFNFNTVYQKIPSPPPELA